MSDPIWFDNLIMLRWLAIFLFVLPLLVIAGALTWFFLGSDEHD